MINLRNKESSRGYFRSVLQRIYNTFHVFNLVKVFSGRKFVSVIEGFSCERKTDIYRYLNFIWIERLSYETERLHS